MFEFEPDKLLAECSISLYIDYPEELSPDVDDTIIVADANEVVKQVIEAVTALLAESHLSSIPIFPDRLEELVYNVTAKTIQTEKFRLDVDMVADSLTKFTHQLSDIIAPIVQGYIPPLPELFITTLVDVVCRCDCVVLTIYY